MRLKKFLVVMLVAMVGVLTTQVSAANTPETVNTTAAITINKTLTPSSGDVYPDLTEFEFVLQAYSYTLSSTNETSTDDLASNMPAGQTVTVTVALNQAGDAKEGSSVINLDFAGYEAGVYTYKLTETDSGYNDVTYDENTYYVNVYVINQVDENNIPTGETTVGAITVWRNTNASDDALKGTTTDGAVITDGDGKVGVSDSSTPAEISYPFENSYETEADISVSKMVKGNYASTTQLFEYTVTLADGLAQPGTYSVVYYDADGNEAAGLNGNPATITSGEATSISLKDGETFVIVDLPSATTYTIVENQVAGYSGEYTEDGGEATGTSTGSAVTSADLTVTGTLADNAVTLGVLSDEEIEFVNTKEYTVPTGILMNVLPFVCGIVLIGAVVLLTTRKREEEV